VLRSGANKRIRRGAFPLTLRFSLRGQELNSDGELRTPGFGDSDDFRRLRLIQGGSRIRVWKCHVETLTLPIPGAAGDKEKPVSRNVHALADFFERLGGVDRADMHLGRNFCALAATAFDAGWIGSRGSWACLCGDGK